MRNAGLRIDSFYTRPMGLWIALYKDSAGYQYGDAGYGPTRQDAINDLRYQNKELRQEESTGNGTVEF